MKPNKKTKWLAVKIECHSDDYWEVGGFIIEHNAHAVAYLRKLQKATKRIVRELRASACTHLSVPDDVVSFTSFIENEAILGHDGDPHRVFETGEPEHEFARTDSHQLRVFPDGEIYLVAYCKDTPDYVEAKLPEAYWKL